MEFEETVESNDAESQENEDGGSNEIPTPGHVRSLVSKLESAFESPSNRVHDGPTSPFKNGKPVFPVKQVPFLLVDDGEGQEEDVTRNVTQEKEVKSCSPDEESSGVLKIFPWISSLSRTKSKERKSRRNSQFYSSQTTDSLNDDLLLDPASESELPGMLSPTPRYDPDDGAGGSMCSGSMEFAPLDSDGDSIQNMEAPSSVSESTSLKSYLVAKELVTSEEVYIETLRLLNVHFRNFVEYNNHNTKTKTIPDTDLRKILNHFPELQSLNEDLLSDLKVRLVNWETNPKISDVIVKKGAFLKMYSTYIQNFESQTQFLDDCSIKYLKFGKLVKDFEATERCKKLSLKHYMLKPVQRIPQYRLLLDDYLKHLCVTSPDYEDTLTALRIVTNVAEHVNNSMKHGDQVGRMVQLQSMLGDFQLIKPGRELIKDGPLQKVCRKTAKDRYFILLNDCLLYSTPSKTYLKFHQTLSLGGMKVTYSEDDSNLYTFAVYSTAKSFILCAKSETERKEWVEALRRAIDDYVTRKKSFMLHASPSVSESFQLGKEAPLWTPDGKVTMCQLCTAEFTQLFRRHHCRACGKVICWKCSDNQAPLSYKSYKPQRVCDPCFVKLLQDFEENEESIKQKLSSGDDDSVQNAYLCLKAKFVRSSNLESSKQKKVVPTRLKEVTAKDSEADMSGWLRHWKSHKWKVDRNWYVLKDRVLYVYGASEDVAATKSISVLGYQIQRTTDESFDNVKPELIFMLTHPHQPPMIFAAETSELTERLGSIQ